jgi:hypothetical protein
MRKDQHLGLDELMIVNPSSSGMEAMFLGEDGTLYEIGLVEEQAQEEMGQYFLGADGSLYQVQGVKGNGSTNHPKNSGEGLGQKDGHTLGRYFLGDDGVLYEVVAS